MSALVELLALKVKLLAGSDALQVPVPVVGTVQSGPGEITCTYPLTVFLYVSK